MSKILIVVLGIWVSCISAQTTYSDFKKDYKKFEKKYSIVDSNHQYLKRAITAFEKSQYPIFKRLIKQYLADNNNLQTYLALAQFLEKSDTYKGQELAKWILEEAENELKYSEELQFMLAYVYERIAREFKYSDLFNRLLIAKAIGCYENIIEKNPENQTAKYHLSRYAMEEIEEHYNSEISDIATSAYYKKDYEILNPFSIQDEKLHNEIINSTAIKKFKGNSAYIVNAAFHTLEKNIPSIINSECKYDYTKLLVKSYYIDNQFSKCIEVLNLKPDDKKNESDYLWRGICNYSLCNYSAAQNDFLLAIDLMNEESRKDFTFNSFNGVLEEKYGEMFSGKSELIKRKYISTYLKMNDPIYLTDENERLLEHYFRVAYANLFFTVDLPNRVDLLKGWQSDRGETLIRYGKPINVRRLRTKLAEAKTEVWTYIDKEFGFVDKFRNNLYVFAENTGGKFFRAQHDQNTYEFINEFRKRIPQQYLYQSPGEVINISHKLYQMKDFESNKTKLYLPFTISEADSNFTSENNSKFSAGIFLIDNYAKIINSSKTYLNCLKDKPICFGDLSLNVHPQKTNFSFEVLRESDNGSFLQKGQFDIEDYSADKLKMSDIVIAGEIKLNNNKTLGLKRQGLYVKPLLKEIYTENDELWLYFETYNFKLLDGLNKFTQNVEIQKFNDDGEILETFSKLGEFLGLSENKNIEISTSYQTKKIDEQIYFQLDLTDLESGKYRIKITIKDLNSEEISSKSLIINYLNTNISANL